ncbi:MAG: hypothetical protein FJ291_33310 [Planctomycetes bacterium]|nr:hypothetical protein [Planctomycetota bacterium]
MLSALYYPFSRCIDPVAIKQLLLVFDSITFLDPVTDDQWRARLMDDMIADEDPRFADYRAVHNAAEELRKEGAVSVVSPGVITNERCVLSAVSALSDLLDQDWCRVACRPDEFQMPHRRYAQDGSATWQIFRPKMPTPFVEALLRQNPFRKHLVREGDETSAWTLSYEAGSAISISLHLAASEQMSLAPVTDSAMHHQLLLRKYARDYYQSNAGRAPVPPRAIGALARQTAYSLVRDVLPVEALKRVSLNEVLAFRREMAPQRDRFIADLTDRFSLCKSEATPERLHQLLLEMRREVTREASDYQNELAKARDKVWPQLVASLGKGLASGGLAAVSFNFIAGPGFVLAGSVVASAITFLKGLLDIRAELTLQR